MRLLDWEDFVGGYEPPRPIAATIGVFDGLHLGHRRLIERVLARKPALAAAFTFAESPKKILRPHSYAGDLQTRAQKLEGFEALGIELCVLIDFSGNFSKLPGRDFLSRLQGRASVTSIAVGSDFRCGHRLDTDAAAIAEFCRERGIEAECLPHVNVGGHPVSSSRIRTALAEGRLDDAAAMLGRPYELDLRGSVSLGARDGLVRLSRPAGLVLPPAGRYECLYFDEGGARDLLVRLGDGDIALEGIVGELPERISFQGRGKD